MAAAQAFPTSALQNRKRKAQNDSDDRYAYRKKSRTSFRSPARGSINDILRVNCRERLYLPPIQWTYEKHLRRLNCHFLTEMSCQSDTGINAGNGTVNRLRKAMAKLKESSFDPRYKEEVINTLLGSYFFRDGRLALPFYFQRSPVYWVRATSIFSLNPGSTPILAYISLKTINKLRYDSVQISRSNRAKKDRCIGQIRQKLQRNLQPSSEEQDPYIASLMIVLAHQKLQDGSAQREWIPGNLTKPDFVQVYVLGYPDSDPLTHLLFYKGYVPVALLDQLDHPSDYIESKPFPVSCCRLPLTESALHQTLSSVVSRLNPAESWGNILN